jgi:hypothetical protein
MGNFALAAEYHRTPSLELFAETLANTATSPEGAEGAAGSPNVLVPEAAGGELVGSIGAAYRPRPDVRFSLGVSYDNNNAVQVRPGIAVWIH